MPTSSRGSRRDFAALEARRFRAAEMFARGESQAAVARVLGVTTAAGNHWYQAWQAKGRRGLKAAGRAGRKPRLGPADLGKLERTGVAGVARRAGLHDGGVDVAARGDGTRARDRRGPSSGPCLGLGVVAPAPRPAIARARRGGHRAVEEHAMAAATKKPSGSARGSSSKTRAASRNTR